MPHPRGCSGSTMVLLVALGVSAGACPKTLRGQSGGERAGGMRVGTPRAACESASGQEPGAVAGRRITAIAVVTHGPITLPGAIRVPLHATTREATIRDQLLFAVGDFVDTLRIAESMRQLRRLPYLAGAATTAECRADGAVLTVSTRDAWSIKPRLSLNRGNGGVAGIEETNLFGTGRGARVYARSDRGQSGLGVAYRDPTLFHGRIIGTMSRDTYRDGGAWAGSLRTKGAGVFRDWGLALDVRQSTRRSIVTTRAGTTPGDTVRRQNAAILVSRRMTYSTGGATFLVLGADAERTALVAGATVPLAGPPRVRRTFAGIDVGLTRLSGVYITAPWLLPVPGSRSARYAPAEIPLGFELEAVASIGRDVGAGLPASRMDVWGGRVWTLGWKPAVAGGNTSTPRAVLSTDLWASGYRTLRRGDWSAGALRGSVALVAPASHGLWSSRVSAEELVDPDPDVRSLAMAEPALRAIPPSSRLAQNAMSASLERSVHLIGAHRGYALDAALFGAGSMRWDRAAPLLPLAGSRAPPRGTAGLPPVRYGGAERLYVGTVGVGLRLVPVRFGRATLRLDVGLPVIGSPQVSGRPYVGFSITPAFGSGRHRDGTTAP